MIVRVDPSDELNTVIHRVRQVEDDEVVVVFPDKGEPFQDPVLMHLLSQYAQEWGKTIIIDSGDPVIRSNAETAGLDVSKLDSSIQEPQPDESRGSGCMEKLTVVLIILLTCIGLAYFAIPRAVVVVTPAVQEFTEKVKTPLAQRGGVQLVEANTVITRRTPATGRQIVGITKSTGEVVLINQTSEPIFVPRGTIVKTAGETAFVLTQDVEVPAVSAQYFMDIPVEALVSGSKGNVAEGRIQYVLGFDLTVRNPEPTVGGADTVLSFSTMEDVNRAYALVKRDASQLTLESLQKVVPIEGVILLDSLQFDLEIMDQTVLDEETEEVFVSAVSKGKIYVLDREILSQELQSELEMLLPGDFLLVDGSLELSDFVVEGVPGAQTLKITVRGQRRGRVDEKQLLDRLIGQPIHDLEEISLDFPEIGHLAVRNFRGEELPRWRHWLKVQIHDPLESLH